MDYKYMTRNTPHPYWNTHGNILRHKGPSIKYVTLFLMIFYPLSPPCHKLSKILDPPKSMSHFWTKS